MKNAKKLCSQLLIKKLGLEEAGTWTLQTLQMNSVIRNLTYIL